MEEKINIVEILKDKPQRTKLYSSACGKCKLEEVDDKSFKISFYNSKFGFMNGGEVYLDKNGKLYDDGECVVFPSKEMRDWEKFSWKKGDVLSDDGGRLCIFKSFAHSSYLTFKAKLIKHEGPFIKFDTFLADTKDWHKTSDDVAKEYIVEIEKKYNGKLNLETLEIEEHPEFKDGDIVVAEGENKGKKIFIFRYKIRDSNTDEHGYKSYINVNSDGSLFNNMTFYLRKDFVYRPATDSEKQQLFDALEKKGKAWDAEKKQIVDLKPKVELKPFDKVLIRDFESQAWQVSLFGYKDSDSYYCCNGCGWNQCIPYIGNESLLGTTKDVEG